MNTTEKLSVYYDCDINGVVVTRLGNSPNEDKIVVMLLGEEADRFMVLISNQDVARCAINAIDWLHLVLTGEVKIKGETNDSKGTETGTSEIS